MIKKDRNGFIDIIKEHELNITSFAVSDVVREDVLSFVIKLKSSPLEFWTRNYENSFEAYDCNYIPFSPSYKPVGYIPQQGWYNDIQHIYGVFSNWLTQHVKLYLAEQNEVDMWQTIINEEGSFQWQDIDEDDTDFFSHEQRKYLMAKIDEFRVRLIDEYAPNEQKLIEIDRKLNYLTEAIDRLNKFDWKSLLISTLFGIMTTMSLDKGTGEAFFNLVKQVFSGGSLLLK